MITKKKTDFDKYRAKKLKDPKFKKAYDKEVDALIKTAKNNISCAGCKHNIGSSFGNYCNIALEGRGDMRLQDHCDKYEKVKSEDQIKYLRELLDEAYNKINSLESEISKLSNELNKVIKKYNVLGYRRGQQSYQY